MRMQASENDRKERAVNAAWEVFARFGYQKASMQDIARAAGISKSVLFKYYQTKENLYRAVFWRAADEIAAADAEASAQREEGEPIFSAMRRTVDARMRLFARAPYVYAFSYAAAYDTAVLSQELTREAISRARETGRGEEAYRGLREDIAPAQARQMIFWISQGFLGDRRASGLLEPETLKREYSEWIDVMERLLQSKEREG